MAQRTQSVCAQNIKIELTVYLSQEGIARIEVKMGGECVWLTPEQVTKLFGRDGRAFFEQARSIVQGGIDIPVCTANIQTQTEMSTPPCSTNDEKVSVFLSLFRGREDVYARRWESKDGQRTGYSPVCRNEWVSGVCEKPRVKCADCKNRVYVPFDKQAVARHLAGKEVAGVYPLLSDE
ncbi:MAG: hypothetical protein FWH21_10240, partial [Kiritimatiellaeota bacterium]|nr:hypothetical protein [Kiritimatiellota bacterium]